MDTVTDVTTACKTAVDILTDLLCFDMMESGILELHKQDITVFSFLHENIKLFATQAKVTGVVLTVSTEPVETDVLINNNNNSNIGHNVPNLVNNSWIGRYVHQHINYIILCKIFTFDTME